MKAVQAKAIRILAVAMVALALGPAQAAAGDGLLQPEVFIPTPIAERMDEFLQAPSPAERQAVWDAMMAEAQPILDDFESNPVMSKVLTDSWTLVGPSYNPPDSPCGQLSTPVACLRFICSVPKPLTQTIRAPDVNNPPRIYMLGVMEGSGGTPLAGGYTTAQVTIALTPSLIGC